MIPTNSMQQLIKNQLLADPLKEKEIRRIEGMGELYASLSREIDAQGYTYMYSLVIDGKKFFFFSKLNGH